MADDDFSSPYGLTTRAVTPVQPGQRVGQRHYVAPLPGSQEGGHHATAHDEGTDGFAFTNVTPEAAAALLATELMTLPDADMAKTRLPMLRAALSNIVLSKPPELADREAMSLASSIVLSAPRMIAANMPHDSGEYRQEEVRGFASRFIELAAQLGVIADKGIVLA